MSTVDQSQMRRRGREGVKKSQNFADVIYGWPLREKVPGKSYSLENSLRETIYREDLFLHNSSLGQVQPLLLDVHQLALRPQVCNARGYQMSRKQDTICNRGLKIRDHNWPLRSLEVTMHGLGRL